MQLCKFSLTSCRWSLILVQPWEGGIVFLLITTAPQQQPSRWGCARHLFTFLFFKKQMIHIINHPVSIRFSHVFHRRVWSTFDLQLLKCETKAMKWKMIRKWATNPKNSGGEASEWSGVKFRNTSVWLQREFETQPFSFWFGSLKLAQLGSSIFFSPVFARGNS